MFGCTEASTHTRSRAVAPSLCLTWTRNRLHANDRVDPYVAVYEAPSPASIDDVTHLSWRGLMDGAFVRSVIDTAMYVLPPPFSLVRRVDATRIAHLSRRSILSTSQSSGDNNSFISITLHSNLTTLVSYMVESKEAPLRVPGPEAEDTVCLILSKSADRSTWAIAQSVGEWDARWG